MKSVRSLCLLGFFLCLSLFLMGLRPAARGQFGSFFSPFVPPAQPADVADPLPLQRVLVSPERLSRELERVRQGVLVQLPRNEFEARVRRAAQVSEALKKPPLLLEARYRATLTENALIGTGQWTLENPASEAGILPVQPFNLAVRRAQLDNSDALLGEFDGKALGLLVERPGKHALSLEWTSRGDAGPSGLRFELRVPSCALTSFEFDLPDDRVVTLARETCLLSGPRPAGAPHRLLWRVDCAGWSQVDLLVQQPERPGQPPPLVLARLQTRQTLAPDRVETDFDYNLEVVHGAIRELSCACEPTLRPISVKIGPSEIDTWELSTGSAPGSPSKLRIRLPEPYQGSSLPVRIHCLGPVVASKLWTSPGLPLSGAILMGETLSLHIAPELRLDNWQSGDFDLVKAADDGKGGQTLTLQSGISKVRPAREPGRASSASDSPGPLAELLRPTAFIKIQEPDYRVRQVSWWQISPGKSSLTVRLTYEVIRGRLFLLPVNLPPGWTVDQVEPNPKGLFRNWTVIPQRNGPATLMVELLRPLSSSDTAQLTVELRPVQDEENSSSALGATPSEVSAAFPVMVPKGTSLWEGALAISVDPAYQATVAASVPPSSPPAAHERDDAEWMDWAPSALARFAALPFSQLLWGTQSPDYYFVFQNRAVTGTLKLRSRPLRVRAHCTSEVVLASGRAALAVRLLLQPEVGNPNTIDLAVSAPISGRWSWKNEDTSNAVLRMERLYAAEAAPRFLTLGADTALGAANLLSVPPARATLWRLTLAKPLREPLTLETSLDLSSQASTAEVTSHLTVLASTTVLQTMAFAAPWYKPAAGGVRAMCWEVPLISVLTAGHMDGDVRLHLAGTQLVQVEASGLRETAAGSDTPWAWRCFRYGKPPISLVLRGRVADADRSVIPMVNQVQLTTYAEPDGRLLHRYQFQIHNWTQRSLPVKLPAGAQLLAARVDNRWISAPTMFSAGDGTVDVELPVASGTTLHRYEVAYSMTVPPWRLWAHLDAPAPLLPVRPTALRRTWCLPPGLAPLDEARFQRLPGSGGSEKATRAMIQQSLSVSLPLSLHPSQQWITQQTRLVMEGDARLQNQLHEKREWSLGEALDYLTRKIFEGKECLVLDTEAFRAAGLGPRTRIKDEDVKRGGENPAPQGIVWLPSMGHLRLVCIPCRPAPLLTTRRQWQTWQAADVQSRPLPEAVEEAVAAAAIHSHDDSGRFRRAADWLRSPDTQYDYQDIGSDQEAIDENARLSPIVPQSESWAEWEPLAGTPAPQTLVVVRQDALPGIAWALTVLLLLVVWRTRSYSLRWRYGLLLVWIAAGALAMLWSPAALRGSIALPLLAGIFVAVVWYFVSALKPRVTAKSVAPNPLAAALLALAFAMGLPGQAAAPSAHVVLLLPGSSEAPEKQTVLVAPELLKELQGLARRGASGLQGAILQSAKYAGSVSNGTAEMQAEFQVHCFSDEPVLLALPLGGIDLQEVHVDGAVAFPAALGPRQPGYALRIKGKGPHSLRLRFTVAVKGAGLDQDLKFTIPELLQNQLTLTVPTDARYLYAVFGRGAQRVSTDATGMHLEADLGRVNTLQVRWRQQDPVPTPTAVQVQELYLWDLQASIGRLLGVLRYKVNSGAVTKLMIHLPDQMEIRRVEAVPLPSGGSASHLKEWRLEDKGTQKLLHLEFQIPVTTNVLLFLELVSRLPLGPTAELALPTPLDVSFTEGFLAYRGGGRRIDPIEYRRITGIDPDEFAEEWQSAGRDEAGILKRAYRFRRTPGGGPFLRLDLHGPAAPTRCSQDITWRVGLRQAELRATLKVTDLRGEMAVLEWLVPEGVAITNISGTNVRSWSRTGGRVQVWLRRSVREATVELNGWLPLAAENLTTSFHLPCMYLDTAAQRWTFVKLIADRNLALTTRNVQSLWPLPETRISDQERSYVSEQNAYGGTFEIRPAHTNAEVPRAKSPASSPQPPASSSQPSAPSLRPRVLLNEQAAAILDGQQWTHQATYWIYHETGTHVRVQLPAGARLIDVAIAGKETAPLELPPTQLWLPLPGGSGLCDLRLRWVFGPEREPVAMPNLEQPRLLDAANGDTVWTVHVPSGYRILPEAGETATDSAAGQDLRRANAQLLLSGLLSGHAIGKTDDTLGQQLLSAQERFYRYCRYAEYQLDLQGSLGAGAVNGQRLAAWLQQLHAENKQLARTNRFETIRAQAENRAKLPPAFRKLPSAQDDQSNLATITPGGLLAEQGMPSYWRAEGGTLAPRLQLIPVAVQAKQHALGFSGLLIVLLLLAWIVSYFPRVVSTVRSLWPEQLVLLGLLGWQLLELDLVPVFLVLLGICARLIYLGRWALVLLSRRVQVVASANRGSTTAS